jgi:heptosyltransferase II
MPKPSTIFLVKNRALGDSVMGLSSVSYLRKLYPQANIIYAVPQWVGPLYKKAQTDADEIYPFSMKGAKDLWKILWDLKKRKVTHIHEMHQSGRGAKFFKIIAFFLGIPYTFHNHHLKSGTKVLDQGVIKPLIQRDLDGVHSFFGSGVAPTYLEFPPVLEVEKKKKLARVILGVVATRKTKMWPLENYVQLARLITIKYPEADIVIPLSKGNDDLKIKSELEVLGLPEKAKIQHIPLQELPEFFSESSVYIGNDTGLKHIAVATGLKSYTLFGPEPANEWHPYDHKIHPYFYKEGLACRTRTHHYCGLSVCDLEKDNMQCLKIFTPEIVLSEVVATYKDFLPARDQ